MKKLINVSFGYAIAAMFGGVFYREYTKLRGFTGVTALGKLHTHLFLLGMVMFLIVALFAAHSKLTEHKRFKQFFLLYNIGLPLMSVMLVVRGITQVEALALSSGASAAISGVAGIGHILVGAGIVLLFLALRDTVNS